MLFCAGFALIANLPVPAAGGLRLLDVVCLIAAAALLTRFLTCRVAPIVLWTSLLAGMLLPAVLTGLWSGDAAHAAAALRLLLSILCGMMLAQMARESDARPFCAGAAFGGVAVACLALAQLHLHLPALAVLTPPDAALWWYGDRLRATGIWSHPNEMGQVQALGVAYALAFALAARGAGSQACAIVMALAIVSLTFAATQTRAFLAVSALLTVLALLRLASVKGPGGRLAIAGLILAAALAAVWAFGDRFTQVTAGGQTLGDNLSERLATWGQATELLLRTTAGYGFEGRLDAMARVTGAHSATHNAFLSLGLTYGIWIALATFCATLWVAAAPVLPGRPRSPFALTGIALLLLFLAEDSLFSGSMQVALSLAVFSVIVSRAPPAHPSPAPGRLPQAV